MPTPELPHDLDLTGVVALQTRLTIAWHIGPFQPSQSGFLSSVELNHHFNFSLWHEEDIARVDGQGDRSIRMAKRNIDGYNQQRNDAMEAMDDHLLRYIAQVGMNCATPMHTETPGMVLDRMSILNLKRYHMAEEAERVTASSEHRERCAQKLAILEQQLSDLNTALQNTVAEVLNGVRHFRKYRQMKMYNDPQLNPALYSPAKPPV